MSAWVAPVIGLFGVLLGVAITQAGNWFTKMRELDIARVRDRDTALREWRKNQIQPVLPLLQHQLDLWQTVSQHLLDLDLYIRSSRSQQEVEEVARRIFDILENLLGLGDSRWIWSTTAMVPDRNIRAFVAISQIEISNRAKTWLDSWHHAHESATWHQSGIGGWNLSNWEEARRELGDNIDRVHGAIEAYVFPPVEATMNRGWFPVKGLSRHQGESPRSSD